MFSCEAKVVQSAGSPVSRCWGAGGEGSKDRPWLAHLGWATLRMGCCQGCRHVPRQPEKLLTAKHCKVVLTSWYWKMLFVGPRIVQFLAGLSPNLTSFNLILIIFP